MKLTARHIPVKRVSGTLATAFAVSIAVGVCLLWIWAADDANEQQVAQFGSGLAAGLASLAAEPLAQRDRIHLGVLANRTLALDEVAGVAVYTVDSEMLALSGNTQRGRTFTEPVIQDENLIGYVRLHLADAAFASERTFEILMSALAMLLVPIAVVAFKELPVAQWLARRAAAEPSESDPADEPPPMATRYLLTVNLFNQLSLAPQQRDLELRHATELAERVAAFYRAEVTQLPGTGLLLCFTQTAGEDKATHVVYAAFVLSRLLTEGDTWGRYRLGAHLIEAPEGERISGKAPEVRDCTLLSALAREETLVISAPVQRNLPRPVRFEPEPLNNPLLTELESTEPAAWLIRGLRGAQRELVDQQVRELGHSGGGSLSAHQRP